MFHIWRQLVALITWVEGSFRVPKLFSFLHWFTVGKLGKSCVQIVFFFSFKIVDHGGCQGNTARALPRWRHLVALHEATDALHWVVCPALHCRISMAIKIASGWRVFFVAVDFIVGHNHKLKTMLWLFLIKTQLHYCSYSCYKPNCILWAPIVNNWCRFGHHFWRRASDSSKTWVT